MSRDVCGICWCPYDGDGKCGCKPTQPEALRLADELLDGMNDEHWNQLNADAAAELRRLHAELQATERQVEILTDALVESRKMDVDLLRQALDVLENHTAIKHPQQIYYRDSAIAALKERLK